MPFNRNHKANKQENHYTLKIFLYYNGTCEKVIPWRNILVDRPATWNNTKKAILRLYPTVHHVNQYTGVTGQFVRQWKRTDLET